MKKIIGYSLLVIFLIFFGVKWSLYQTGFTQNQHELFSESKEKQIVAPAIIDSLSDITHISTLQSGVVKHLHVKVGDDVKKGQRLITLNDTFARNNVNIQKIAKQEAESVLFLQRNQLTHLERHLRRLKSVDKRAISRVDLLEKTHEVAMAKIQLAQAENHVVLVRANLKNAELILREFHLVAPKDGVVLQLNAHINEFVGAGQPTVFLGNAKKTMVRVSLDERDIQHFRSTAVAYITNNEKLALKIPLTFMQLNRYIVTQERLHTRVQEVLYYFNRDEYPNVVAGQQFDAHILLQSTG